MYEESNPVGAKEALKQQGVCDNYVRMPLLPATEQLSGKIAVGIKAFDLK
jgi:4-hydroxy-tetrahydrodipicolinate synthase